MQAFDLIVDDSCDLIFKDGDFYIDSSDQQHVQFIMKARYGQFRQFPLVGVGIETYQNGSINTQALKREIRTQLEADNYNVRQLLVGYDQTGQLTVSIDAERIR